MEDRDLTADYVAVLGAIEKAAVDVLSDGARKERDRLLLSALTAFALAAAPKLPTSIKLPFLKIEIGGSAFLELGVLVLLLYYFLSFLVLTRTDWLRWKAVLGQVLQEPNRHVREADARSTRIVVEQNAAAELSELSRKEHEGERRRIAERIASLEARRADLKLGHHERAEVDQEIIESQREDIKLARLYDLRPAAEQALEALAAVNANSTFVETTWRRVAALQSLGKMHLWISIVLPGLAAVGSWLLVAWRLVKG